MIRPAPARGYRLVVLDFDGTLADTFPWFCGVLDAVADRYRFRRVAAHETDELRRLSARAIMARLGVPRWKLPVIARHMHGLAARDAALLHPFPGTSEMLAGLGEAGVATAVLSSNTEANVRRVLGPDAARIGRYACGASVFGKARRLASLLRHARIEPRAVLCVGDELRDLDAARAVGCAFGAVAWGYTDGATLSAARPDLMFAEPAQIVEAVLSARR
ncbi:HAD hydrolase-like protein [Methylobacterium sp. WL30]|uniref:HAD hydrolase-like protein n=1 Tax=Methylobacterium sp. WL119 TaxID=2603888 RepID=UPI0011C74814|nr:MULTISPECIES: HAD hydrolase-like protein [unclassified Methylobacterium]TXM94545.1 HAD hydrolase-like protein [Methylobacterium sp. WL116]TXN34707.1 HAD hydrolase-like protein [Methylobacterium sp. WL93]TXN50840.1 HAD hydrolase-like protein [Methylobacterium sp. WL119]TXN66644.1 HAD hydrolase-like protein [Methylobacterium sp. WL30]